MNSSSQGFIRPAVDSDLPIIEAWLSEQKERSEIDTLACNWEITKKVYRERGMLVYAADPAGEPIAYSWGSLNDESSILEVKASHRATGVGAKMVDYLIEQSRAANEPLLLIECAPSSSEPFWQRMGFDTFDLYGRTLAKRVLCLERDLPQHGSPVGLTVRFSTEGFEFAGFPCMVEHKPTAVKLPDGVIYLDQRLAHYEPRAFGQGGELVIEVSIEGRSSPAFFGRCKYGPAADLGVERCENGFAIERISLRDFD